MAVDAIKFVNRHGSSSSVFGRTDFKTSDIGFNALVQISLPNNKIHSIFCQPNLLCCNDWLLVIGGFETTS
jgi:hypothetical protein